MIEKLYSIFKKYNKVTTDTRKIEENTIFFALKGPNFNANSFANEAIEKGAIVVVIDEEIEQKHDNDKYFLVEDVLVFLQQFANHHRKNINIPIIGITGSNGKTTSKELLNAVLSTEKKTFATFGNLNNHIGVPLSILSIGNEVEIAIIEMGANHQKEIELLSNITAPNFGIITNIGKAHIEGFGGVEGILKGKGELYDYIRNQGGKVFINLEEKKLLTISSGLETEYYGLERNPNFQNQMVCGKVLSANPFLKIEWTNLKSLKTFTTSSQLVGDYNIHNILMAIAVGLHFNISEENINKGIENYTPNNNRSQLTKTSNNSLIIDAYNANPTSMEAAIRNFYMIDAPQKVLILGDMFELGDDSKTEHQNIVNLIEELNFETVLLCGENFSQISNKKFQFYKSTSELKNFLSETMLFDKTILLKGSRGMKLDSLVDLL
jgi:UDP-N-acetylmuramoyl-tripeptide--D-alanyl-D-alanine ligase